MSLLSASELPVAQDRVALCAPTFSSSSPEALWWHIPRSGGEQKTPSGWCLLQDHYLLEKLMFCKAFPSPGYAKCWPKPQCVPWCYHP